MSFVKRLNQKTAETVATVGFPFDAHSSFLQGPAEAPPLIWEAVFSPSANSWSETGVDLAPMVLARRIHGLPLSDAKYHVEDLTGSHNE